MTMTPTPIEILSTVFFALAILHVFLVKRFQRLASRHPEGSVAENFFHLLGEIEVVFGIWAGFFVLALGFHEGLASAVRRFDQFRFTEPAFVFVIMAIAATTPVLRVAEALVSVIARVLPLPREMAFYVTTLAVGPLLGSLITEPAAMTVTALLLRDRFLSRDVSDRFKYATLAVLFVNISIGGVLTPFAAPPVLMVAPGWGWGIEFMATHFGWKAVIAVLVNTAGLALLFRGTLSALPAPAPAPASGRKACPWWLSLLHLAFLGLVVVTAHHPQFFMGVFLFFLGIVTITSEFQEELKLKESLLVAFFLGGLVVLGGPQRWWLEPLLLRLDEVTLFLGTTGLTAFLDNAALTYLGAQVPGITPELKYALVAGAVAGGGLTVIANAPNPAGFSILRSAFGKEGISPILLLLHALPPTLVAMAALWFL